MAGCAHLSEPEVSLDGGGEDEGDVLMARRILLVTKALGLYSSGALVLLPSSDDAESRSGEEELKRMVEVVVVVVGMRKALLLEPIDDQMLNATIAATVEEPFILQFVILWHPNKMTP